MHFFVYVLTCLASVQGAVIRRPSKLIPEPAVARKPPNAAGSMKLFEGFNATKTWGTIINAGPITQLSARNRFTLVELFCRNLDTPQMKCRMKDSPEVLRLPTETNGVKELVLPYHMAFGAFSIAFAVDVFQPVAVRLKCLRGAAGRIYNCKDGFWRDTVLVRFPVAPLAERMARHLSDMVFMDKNNVKTFSPFPAVVEFPAQIKKILPPMSLIIEAFGNTVTLSNLDRQLELLEFNENVSKQVLQRLVYIYLLYGLFFAENQFNHGDFHASNILVDLNNIRPDLPLQTQIRLIDMSSVKIIDLDTSHFVVNRQAVIRESSSERAQAVSPDAYMVSAESIRLTQKVNPANAKLIKETMTADMCQVRKAPCSVPAARLTLLHVCRHIKDLSPPPVVANLPPCDTVTKEFYVTSGEGFVPPPNPAFATRDQDLTFNELAMTTAGLRKLQKLHTVAAQQDIQDKLLKARRRERLKRPGRRGPGNKRESKKKKRKKKKKKPTNTRRRA